MANSFTNTAEHIASVLESTCAVSPAWDPESGDPAPPTMPCVAIWDTGATRSVISGRVVEECGLRPTGVVTVATVQGSTRAPTYLINLALHSRVLIPGLHVTEGEVPGAEVLIGMDVITLGDLAVANAANYTQFSFRIPSQGHIDFVAEAARGRRPLGPPKP